MASHTIHNKTIAVDKFLSVLKIGHPFKAIFQSFEHRKEENKSKKRKIAKKRKHKIRKDKCK
jgi:DeoR/GlpR family transcriptional regulator of sugar metabolism